MTGRSRETQQGLSHEEALAIVIANTKKPRPADRPNNLLQVAEAINCLASGPEGMSAVARVTGVSTEMLRRFLSVKRLTPAVRRLLESRQIDSLNEAHYMSRLPPSEQTTVARAIISGSISGSDVRALVPMHRRNRSIDTRAHISAISRYKNSRRYAVIIPTTATRAVSSAVARRLVQVAGRKEFIGLRHIVGGDKLLFTARGIAHIRSAASKEGLSLRNYVSDLVTTTSRLSRRHKTP